jgi:DNA mismatch repair protein MutS2
VEPMEIVEPSNEMRALQAVLKEEENEIYFQMLKNISHYRAEIRASVTAAAEVDVYCAKARLGLRLGGVVPEVGSEGAVKCRNARHPVLLLRNQAQLGGGGAGNKTRSNSLTELTRIAAESAARVVGNDISLNASASSLVISGPNAGGKTIVLKTCGLFALMVRHGLPVPAQRGARVDFFEEVMADIGDLQSVSGDLSTFSGHLTVCRQMLARIIKQLNSRGGERPHCLVLLDEIGTGTDPAQGAALAQAILEELVNEGQQNGDVGTGTSRVIVTTHYQRIKELAASDPRFRISAMEFVDNKPTYRLRVGAVGESYALETASRLRLPQPVLVRAESLLDNESRRLIALQKALEEETEHARRLQETLAAKLADLEGREASVEASRREVAGEIQQIRDGLVDRYVADLKQKERDLQALMLRAEKLGSARLLSGAGQMGSSIEELALAGVEQPDGDGAGAQSSQTTLQVMNNMKNALKQERVDVEKEVVGAMTGAAAEVAKVAADPLEPGEPVEAGATLVVLERGSLLGCTGVVTQKNKGRGRIALRIAGAEIKIDRHLVGRPHSGLRAGRTGLFSEKEQEEMSAKQRKLIKMTQGLVEAEGLYKHDSRQPRPK